MKRKIELFMVLFLLMGAIIVSWKLSELTANVSNEGIGTKEGEVVIVIDPGHGGYQLCRSKEKVDVSYLSDSYY